MRYFLTGFGLFLLMTLFVRTWYVETNRPPKVIVNESPKTLSDTSQKTPEVIFSGDIILKDDLLLKPIDYQEIEKAIVALRKYPPSKLDIFLPIGLDTSNLDNTLRTILTDQGILATRFQFLRKQAKLTKELQISLQVK